MFESASLSTSKSLPEKHHQFPHQTQVLYAVCRLCAVLVRPCSIPEPRTRVPSWRTNHMRGLTFESPLRPRAVPRGVGARPLSTRNLHQSEVSLRFSPYEIGSQICTSSLFPGSDSPVTRAVCAPPNHHSVRLHSLLASPWHTDLVVFSIYAQIIRSSLSCHCYQTGRPETNSEAATNPLARRPWPCSRLRAPPASRAPSCWV